MAWTNHYYFNIIQIVLKNKINKTKMPPPKKINTIKWPPCDGWCLTVSWAPLSSRSCWIAPARAPSPSSAPTALCPQRPPSGHRRSRPGRRRPLMSRSLSWRRSCCCPSRTPRLTETRTIIQFIRSYFSQWLETLGSCCAVRAAILYLPLTSVLVNCFIFNGDWWGCLMLLQCKSQLYWWTSTSVSDIHAPL